MSQSKKLGIWFRIVAGYVVVTSIGFGVWRTMRVDAGPEIVGLLVGFVLAAIMLLFEVLLQVLRRDWSATLLALIFMLWSLFSAWTVLNRLARA